MIADQGPARVSAASRVPAKVTFAFWFSWAMLIEGRSSIALAWNTKPHAATAATRSRLNGFSKLRTGNFVDSSPWQAKSMRLVVRFGEVKRRSSSPVRFGPA